MSTAVRTFAAWQNRDDPCRRRPAPAGPSIGRSNGWQLGQLHPARYTTEPGRRTTGEHRTSREQIERKNETGMTDFHIAPISGGLTVIGELDFETVPKMRSALEPFAGRAVTLDLAGLAFIDSSGLKALVAARKAATAVRIINAPTHVRLLLDLTGLTAELGVE
jgi:anti-anti-sigma factor